ncbi:diaminobutyrate--2-oxoglutarate transaminase [Albidovulum sp.]|uniref:diaminobutyrate--2-oxoglutarate transaminase n=1 Tax=Albidovulum sp. TaxID=1872424 RepID=UPI003D7C6CE5
MLDSAVVSYSRSTKIVWQRGYGHQIFDVDGRAYLDFLSGCGALNYGHNDPDMKAALLDYISGDNIAMGLDFFFDAKEAFMKAFQVSILAPRNLDYRLQFPGPTGTNAVEAAIKIARKFTGKSNVISFTNGYHGCTLGALALTGNQNYRTGSHALLGASHRLPFDGYVQGLDSAAYLARLLDDPSSGIDNVAAVVFECVQGEGGLNVASACWAQEIVRICHQRGILVIVDDIQAGCGRTGSFFSFEELGIAPDIVTLSKSISGFGIPFALTLIRPDVDIWNPGEHTGTFRGNAHACVTGRVACEKFWSDGTTADRTARLSGIVTDHLDDFAASFGLHRKGRGLLQGLDVGTSETARAIQAQCLTNGLLLECCGPQGEVVKLMPPLTIPGDALIAGLGVIGDAITAACARANVRPHQRPVAAPQPKPLSSVQ